MKRTKMRLWTDPDACSGCKHCLLDADQDPYCLHPVVKTYHPYGVNLNKAISAFCGENLSLREQKETAVISEFGGK